MVRPLNAIPSAESTYGGGGGFGGIYPEKIFNSRCLWRGDFACDLRFIVQTLHDAVFKSVSKSATKV